VVEDDKPDVLFAIELLLRREVREVIKKKTWSCYSPRRLWHWHLYHPAEQ
jgi:hypothetical protein